MYKSIGTSIIFVPEFNNEFDTQLIEQINLHSRLYLSDVSNITDLFDTNTDMDMDMDMDTDTNTNTITNTNTNTITNTNIYVSKQFDKTKLLSNTDIKIYRNVRDPNINYNYSKFNKSIDCLANTNLTHIFFNTIFNKKIKAYPKNLLYLQFGGNYNQELVNLPVKLEYLVLGESFDKPLDKPLDNNCLPKNLTHLAFSSRVSNYPIYCLPDKLIFLDLSNTKLISNNYPNTLEYLLYGNCFNQPVLNLPMGLKLLVFGNLFDHPVDTLPNSIVKLIFGDKFNHYVDNLPNSLECLVFGLSFNQSVDNLPNSLVYLKLGFAFTNSIDNLPGSIVYLQLGMKFNHEIKNFPTNLQILTMDKIGFTYSINSMLKIPSNIQLVLV